MPFDHPMMLEEVFQDSALEHVARMWIYRAQGIALLGLQWKRTTSLPLIVRTHHAEKEVVMRWKRIVFLLLKMWTNLAGEIAPIIARWKEATSRPLKVLTDRAGE